MTIERFGGWGTPADADASYQDFANDSALASAAMDAHLADERLCASVATGDLLRTLGLDSPRPAAERYEYPLDLVVAHPILDGGPASADAAIGFVAHLLAGKVVGPKWSCAAVNTPWWGDWRLGPRAHPNDGLVDVTLGSIPWTEALEARRRVKTGSHLPHPALEHKRVSELTVQFPRPLSVMVDGVKRGRWHGVDLTVVPDAIVLVA